MRRKSRGATSAGPRDNPTAHNAPALCGMEMGVPLYRWTGFFMEHPKNMNVFWRYPPILGKPPIVLYIIVLYIIYIYMYIYICKHLSYNILYMCIGRVYAYTWRSSQGPARGQAVRADPEAEDWLVHSQKISMTTFICDHILYYYPL